MKRYFIEILTAVTLVTLAHPSFAEMIREPKVQSQPAKMRIQVKITPFEKYMVKDKYDKIEGVFKELAPLSHNLRARIDQPNHFYVDKWHIETDPVAWQNTTKKITIQMRFYKLYGKHRALEQFVGSTHVSGYLKGKDFLYDFVGDHNKTFANVLGAPIIKVVVGHPSLPAAVAKKNQNKNQKARESL